MSSFILKVIAVMSMIFDHSGYIIFKHFSFFNYIGRLAFPIFAFQISEGYSHTKSLKKYFLRLGVFALISQIPFMLFLTVLLKKPMLEIFELNIFFTLLLGLLSITILDKYRHKGIGYSIISVVLVCLIAYCGELLHVDYGAFGVLLIASFYLFKDYKLMLFIDYIILVLWKYSSNLFIPDVDYRYIILAVSTALAIMPILLYNGKQGRKAKYFLYAFYPIHMLVLYLISLL